LLGSLGFTGLTEGGNHDSVIPVTVIPVTPRILTIARNITGHMSHVRAGKLSSHNSTRTGLAMSAGRGRC
jgi:hypothetical protein